MSGELIRELNEEEYLNKFQVNSCQRCGSRKIKIFDRTKSRLNYKVYACGKCKCVIKREIS